MVAKKRTCFIKILCLFWYDFDLKLETKPPLLVDSGKYMVSILNSSITEACAQKEVVWVEASIEGVVKTSHAVPCV